MTQRLEFSLTDPRSSPSQLLVRRSRPRTVTVHRTPTTRPHSPVHR